MRSFRMPPWSRNLAILLAIMLGTTLLTAEIAFAKVSKGEASIAKRSAKLYMKQRQYNKAIEQYSVAVEGNPGDWECQYYLGWLYGERELYEEMDHHFKAVEETDHKKSKKWKKEVDKSRMEHWRRHYNLGVKGINAQKFDFAIEEFQSAMLVKPDEADTYKGLGIVYIQTDQLDQGIEMYKKGIEMAPKDAQAYFNLSSALINIRSKESLADAKTYLNQGLEYFPKDVNLLKMLGMTQAQLGEKMEAAATAEKALEINPDDPAVLNLASQMYLQAEEYEKSIAILEKLIPLDPDNSDAIFNLAVAYKALDQGDRALDLFKKSVESDPDDEQSWYQLGLLADKIENFDESIAAFSKYTELKPAEARGWRALSRAYARKSNTVEGPEASKAAKKAEETFKMAESLDGDE
ncbi:MAG: tetratricopeptide repeat protein [bacterium]|nr:tetratricopeptide repeat protein [bacterium]